MRNYKLNIELSFLADTDALQVMDACHELMKGLEPEQDSILIKKFQDQVDSSVVEMEKVVAVALEQKPKLLQLLSEANADLEKVRQYKGESDKNCKELLDRINYLVEVTKSTSSSIGNEINNMQSVINVVIKKLADLDFIISEAKKRVEACLFLKDMARVKQSLLTGGKVALIQKDDLGNWYQSKVWEK